jgi:hypothetical protein
LHLGLINRLGGALVTNRFKQMPEPSGAMTIIRMTISLFILVLIAVSSIGWIWTGGHQPAAQAAASRVVLTLGVIAGIVGLVALWFPGRPKPPGRA